MTIKIVRSKSINKTLNSHYLTIFKLLDTSVYGHFELDFRQLNAMFLHKYTFNMVESSECAHFIGYHNHSYSHKNHYSANIVRFKENEPVHNYNYAHKKAMNEIFFFVLFCLSQFRYDHYRFVSNCLPGAKSFCWERVRPCTCACTNVRFATKHFTLLLLLLLLLSATSLFFFFTWFSIFTRALFYSYMDSITRKRQEYVNMCKGIKEFCCVYRM